MHLIHDIRSGLTGIDRRLLAAGAALATISLVGGVALAMPNSTGTSSASRALGAPPASVPVAAADRALSPTSPLTNHSVPDDAAEISATEPDDDQPADSPDMTTVPASTAPTTTDAASAAPTTTTAPDLVSEPIVTTPPPSTTTVPVPTPDELEPTPGPDAGQVVVANAVTEPPTHPTFAPTMSIVELDRVEDVAPAPQLPEAVPVPPLVSPDMGLTSNAFGCASNCITHALLSPVGPLSPNLEFDLLTKVDTNSALWVSETQPIIDEGEIVINSWPNYFSGGFTAQWQTLLELDYSTNYWIVLRVEDAQDNVKWAITDITTRSQPTADDLAANGDGCYFQCINFGKVEFRDTYDTVDIVIGTSVPAHEDVFFEIAVSSHAPTWFDDVPALESEHLFVVDQDGGNDIRGHVSGLAASTTYHVLVKATDQDGYSAHAIGQFTTDVEPPPVPTDVRVSWHRVFVHHDGDTGAYGRGELSFVWGVVDGPFDTNWGTPYTSVGWTNEDKIGDGTSVSFGCCSHHWVSVFEGEPVPDIAVTAHENDTHGNFSYESCLEYRQRTFDIQIYQDTCMTRTNVAFVKDLTIDDIVKLPKCWQYDVAGEKSEDYCLVLGSLDANDNHAQFDALISFKVGA